MQDEELQQQEWEMLYDSLIELLSHRGMNDPYGNGQYYVVEDNNGETEHIVKIFEIPLINPPFVTEVQREMVALKLEWQVKFQIETFDPRYTGKGESIIVFKDKVEEYYDKERLKREMPGEYTLIN